jgi:hypothetical protein
LYNTSSINDYDELSPADALPPVVPSTDALPPVVAVAAAGIPIMFRAAAPGIPPAPPAASLLDVNVAATHALALLKERGKKKIVTLPPSDQSNEESKMLVEKLSAKKPKKDFI